MKPRFVLRRLASLLALAMLVHGCRDGSGEASAKPAPAPAAEAAPEQEARLSSPPGLARFYRDLARLQSGKLEHVHILQLGDSHTAGDVLSGRLRALFQERFGDAGRGLMPPGLAFEGLRQKEVSVSQSRDWEIDNSLKLPDGGPYGVTGFTAKSTAPGARMAIASNDPNGFDTATVDYLERPAGGRLEVLLDGQVAKRLDITGPLDRPGRLVLPAPPGTHELGLVALDPGLAVTGWSLERRERGVLLESQGVVAAQVTIFERWNPEILQKDFEHLKPSLVILAYGTNEGFAGDFDPAAYAENFAMVLSRIRELAPQASILIIAPPDGGRIDGSCSKRKTAPLKCHWSTPSALASVRQIQHDAARAIGAAYWDWSTLMGGAGGIDRWVRKDPPLARQDHVHFTREGYELAADALFSKLMEGYAAYAAGVPARTALRQ